MNIKLDSVLLFSFVIPFIMSVRLGPGETPYWLFGLIFLGLLSYLLLDLLRIRENLYSRIKHVLLWIIILMVVGSSFISAIIVRHQTAPIYQIHDIVIQQEAAIHFLLDGKNPYAVTYFGTPLEQWHYSTTDVNPALYHFVMQPFYLLFALLFYFASITLFGFFDGRMPLFVLFLLLLILAAKLVKDDSKRRLFLILLAFNPANIYYTLEGRSDIFMFAFLFLCLVLLHKRKYALAGIPIGLAFAVKQSVWPMLPFYVAFLYIQTKDIGRTIRTLIPFLITTAVIMLPFFFWDKKAFLDSTVFYLSGNAPNNYPISGYGFGKMLHEAGFIKDPHQFYPFHIWQMLVGTPVFVALVLYLRKAPSVGRFVLVYGIFLFLFWYLSRYFNNSHLGYLSIVFITAYFWPRETVST